MDELLESSTVKSRGDPDFYLFDTMYGDIQFVIIDTEMSQLNDFCCLILEETEAKIQSLKNQLIEYEKHPFKGVSKEHVVIQEEIAFSIREFDLPIWKDTFYFLARANCVMLLQSFLERSLKSLYFYTIEKPTKQKATKGKSQIESYINDLQNKCSLSFEVEQEIYDLLNETREVRNAFAHGDWDEVRDLVKDISLRDSFRTMTHLFSAIERAFEKKG